MVSFEELKKIPKLDLHINFLSSISDNLAFDLDNELSFEEVMDMSTLKRFSEYDKCLELPIKLLNNVKNIKLAVVDLIERLKKDNVIYSELFLDLPLYNRNISISYLIDIILKTIEEEKYDMNIILCTSDKFSKEENMKILDLLDKYYNHGVSGVYFNKSKGTNLVDYVYLFDKLIKNNIPYIIPYNDLITNQNHEIYLNASRIEYLFDNENNEIFDLVKENNITLEFSFSKIQELNFGINIYNLVERLFRDNVNISINSLDMIVLNTDIINEYCLLFNNCELSLRDLVKLLINNLNNLKINDIIKERLIKVLKDESNEIL